MGFIARLLGKTKRTAVEAGAASPVAGAATGGTPAPDEAEASEVVPVTVATRGEAGDGAGDGSGDGGTDAAEGTDIPKQQTVDKAADNEAGESARA